MNNPNDQTTVTTRSGRIIKGTERYGKLGFMVAKEQVVSYSLLMVVNSLGAVSDKVMWLLLLLSLSTSRYQDVSVKHCGSEKSCETSD